MKPMQVLITLDGRESELVHKSAERNLRKPKDEVRMLLRQALGLTGDSKDRSVQDADAQRSPAPA